MAIRSTAGSWVHNMLGSIPVVLPPMHQRQAWEFIEPTRCALQRLLDGVGGHEDVATVGIAFNMAHLHQPLPAYDAAGLVLGAMDAVVPPRGPNDEEKEALCIAITLYDKAVRGCPRDTWVNLMFRLMEHATQGHATV